MLRSNGVPFVAAKPICEAIGIDWDGQRKTLKSRPWSTTVESTVVAQDGKLREMTLVDRRTLTMWLATIQTGKVKNPDARTLLEHFQCEAADALDKYFNDGGALNPNATEHQINALIFQARAQMELCQAAKGLIHPDHLEAKARVILARGLGEHAQLDAGTRPLYVKSFLKEKNLSSKQMRKTAGTFGKRVKAAYTLEHGEEPKKYPLTLSNGQTHDVYAYTEADRELLEHVWNEYYAPTKQAA